MWSPVSNALAGVILSSCIPGETVPPAKQSTKSLSPVEREQKEAIVFNNAMQSCADHWKDLTFDGFPVNATVVKCNEDELKFKDYETIKEFLSCPLRDLHKFSQLKKEFDEMLKHVDRHLNELVFTKCSNEKCCGSWISKKYSLS